MKCVIASSAKFMENKEKKIVGVFDSIKCVEENKKKSQGIRRTTLAKNTYFK